MMYHVENLCAALLLFAALCCAGAWWLGRDGAQDYGSVIVEAGRE